MNNLKLVLQRHLDEDEVLIESSKNLLHSHLIWRNPKNEVVKTLFFVNFRLSSIISWATLDLRRYRHKKSGANILILQGQSFFFIFIVEPSLINSLNIYWLFFFTRWIFCKLLTKKNFSWMKPRRTLMSLSEVARSLKPAPPRTKTASANRKPPSRKPNPLLRKPTRSKFFTTKLYRKLTVTLTDGPYKDQRP